MNPVSKKSSYQRKKNSVCIVLYDHTGAELSPVAQEEAENAMLEVALNHNLLLSITEG